MSLIHLAVVKITSMMEKVVKLFNIETEFSAGVSNTSIKHPNDHANRIQKKIFNASASPT